MEGVPEFGEESTEKGGPSNGRLGVEDKVVFAGKKGSKNIARYKPVIEGFTDCFAEFKGQAPAGQLVVDCLDASDTPLRELDMRAMKEVVLIIYRMAVGATGRTERVFGFLLLSREEVVSPFKGKEESVAIPAKACLIG